MERRTIQAHTENTQREVLKMQWQGESARAIVTRRSYPTDIEDLWHACVTPERLKRWFGPVTGDLREGGTYQIEGNAHGTILGVLGAIRSWLHGRRLGAWFAGAC